MNLGFYDLSFSFLLFYFLSDSIFLDGTTFASITKLKQQWGVAPHRYFALKTQFWISSQAAKIFHRTTGYANWVKPLLQHTFKNYDQYQKELASINTQLYFLNQNSNQYNKGSRRDTASHVDSQHGDLGVLGEFSHNDNQRLKTQSSTTITGPDTFSQYVDATMCHQIECHCSSWFTPKLLQLATVEIDEPVPTKTTAPATQATAPTTMTE